ncbi:GNAT family N-acetyltransferase [Rhodopseudomonas palustris]
MSTVPITVLAPGMAELEVCARWRAETFSVLNASAADELASLQAFVAEPTDQVALMAMHDGQPAGTALLARSEIAPVHDVTPWLAGLYVAPAHRRHGVGAALVRAIEGQARQRGHRRLFLYTTDAADYYQRLGWGTVDRARWNGANTVLMAIDL